jgi:hypothetical protein
VVAGKTGLLFFQPTFNPKHQGNTFGTLYNQSMASQNAKNHPKTHNQPETKKSSKAQIFFYFRCFQGKKTLNLNSLHHMETFDTKSTCFSG